MNYLRGEPPGKCPVFKSVSKFRSVTRRAGDLFSGRGLGLGDELQERSAEARVHQRAGAQDRVAALRVHALERLGRGDARGKLQLLDVDELPLERHGHEHAEH
jgi:hypothetical protein